MGDSKVYIGNLGNDGSRTEIEDAFRQFGSVRDVWVARKPPGFAFVEFEDPRDAKDAVREMDGSQLCGHRVRVELSTRTPRSSRHGGSSDSCYDCGERGHFARECPRSRRRSRSPHRGRRSLTPVARRARSRSRSRSYSRSPRRSPRRSPSYK